MLNGEMILSVIYYIIYMVALMFIGQETFHCFDKKRHWVMRLIVICSILILVDILRLDTISFIFFLLGTLLFISLGKEKIWKSIVFYVYTQLLEWVIDIPICLLMVYLCTSKYQEDIIYSILSCIATCVCYTFVSRCNWYRKFFISLQALSLKEHMMVMAELISALILILIGVGLQTIVDSPRVLWTFRAAMILELLVIPADIILLVRALYDKRNYIEQVQLKEEIIEEQKKYYHTIYQNNQEIRGFRHDISTHLGALEVLLENNDGEKAKGYLRTLREEFSHTKGKIFHIGDEVLDALVNSMYCEAKEKQIEFTVEGAITESIADTYDLCMIFSNAISNAKEACERITDRNTRIGIFILAHNGTLLLRFENTAIFKMYEQLNSGMTSKQDMGEHGFGVKNIQRAVEKYNGTMEYRYEDEKIILEIFLEA